MSPIRCSEVGLPLASRAGKVRALLADGGLQAEGADGLRAAGHHREARLDPSLSTDGGYASEPRVGSSRSAADSRVASPSPRVIRCGNAA